MKTAHASAPAGSQRYRVIVAYDGAPYRGWQLQPGRTTIQSELESALQRITGKPTRIHSSGRTDAGVHAAGQVIHFDLPNIGKARSAEKGLVFKPRGKRWLPKDLLRALNAVLPETIRITSVSFAKPAFNARFDAIGKAYRYHIFNAPVMPPLERFAALHIPDPLDVPAMRAAAAILEGTHDFAAFSANPHRETNGTVRTLHRLRVQKRGPLITITAVGDGFLYKMVRSLAGHLLRVGRGRVPPEDTRAILESRVRTARVETAPAHGLALLKVFYTRIPR